MRESGVPDEGSSFTLRFTIYDKPRRGQGCVNPAAFFSYPDQPVDT